MAAAVKLLSLLDVTPRCLQIYCLVLWCHQGLRLQIPLDEENGRAVRAKRQEPLSIFDDHALGLSKVQCSIGSSPIADQEGKSNVTGTTFPFAVRPVKTWRPGSGRNEQLCAL